MSDMSQLSDYL